MEETEYSLAIAQSYTDEAKDVIMRFRLVIHWLRIAKFDKTSGYWAEFNYKYHVCKFGASDVYRRSFREIQD